MKNLFIEQQLPRIAHIVQITVDKMNEYGTKPWMTKAYLLAMGKHTAQLNILTDTELVAVISPLIKFTWIKAHWTAEEHAKAEWLTCAVVRQA